jgi:hypothetical protein
MDLGGWLRSLGLEKYEAAFLENEISEKGGVGACCLRRKSPSKIRRRPPRRTRLPLAALSVLPHELASVYRVRGPGLDLPTGR